MSSRSVLPVLTGLAFLLLGSVLAAPVRADDDECLGCHAPAEEVVDLEYQVEPDSYMASIHAEMGFGCTDCHAERAEEVES